jgi:hypothetical protein
MVLLVLIAAFLGLTGYRYIVKATFDWTTLMPVAGLLVFYLIIRPKAK